MVVDLQSILIQFNEVVASERDPSSHARMLESAGVYVVRHGPVVNAKCGAMLAANRYSSVYACPMCEQQP